jgi:hypothetical protein
MPASAAGSGVPEPRHGCWNGTLSHLFKSLRYSGLLRIRVLRHPAAVGVLILFVRHVYPGVKLRLSGRGFDILHDDVGNNVRILFGSQLRFRCLLQYFGFREYRQDMIHR